MQSIDAATQVLESLDIVHPSIFDTNMPFKLAKCMLETGKVDVNDRYFLEAALCSDFRQNERWRANLLASYISNIDDLMKQNHPANFESAQYRNKFVRETRHKKSVIALCCSPNRLLSKSRIARRIRKEQGFSLYVQKQLLLLLT